MRLKKYLLTILLLFSMFTAWGVVPPQPAARAARGEISLPQADPLEIPHYSVTELGTLGGTASRAIAVNEFSQVVGSAKTISDDWHAFLWDDGAVTDLGTLGLKESGAHDINDAGQIVGGAYNNVVFSAFLYQDGVMQELGTLGGPDSSAVAINNIGQVVGTSDPATGDTQAFLWENGVMQDLGIQAYCSYAIDINNTGQVVGSYNEIDCNSMKAFLWENGQMQDLGVLGGDWTLPYAINEASQVVGQAIPVGGNYFSQHAFMWQDNVMQDLGTLGGSTSSAHDINDAGWVVGTSRTPSLQQHAVLWANSQIYDLNERIPPDSGWNLESADGINNRGQIVGSGVFNGQTRAFLLTPVRQPVLIVPGIAGTYASDVNYDYSWLLHRGVSPSDLQIDPLGNFYDDLVQTFTNLGYEEGKDLFVANYDWRLMPGPVDDQLDGHISGLDAQSLADDQFEYGVDYLGWYLRKAAEAYRLETGLELDKVSVIAHSTGGLVTRTYLQSDAYGGAYDPGNNYHLPTIDQFIMVGVPNRGASKSWNPIHDNWIADFSYRIVLSKIIDRAYMKVMLGDEIPGPDHTINWASISPDGWPDPQVFIEQYVPTLRTLLATYDFINIGNGYTDLNGDPTQRNSLVLDLNDGLDLVNPIDPNSFADNTHTTAICGMSQSTPKLVWQHSGEAAEDVLLPFSDFFANDAGVEDTWYEDLWVEMGGDGTVPLVSCRDQFLDDPRVNILLFDGEKSDHTGLMGKVEVQSAILDILKVDYQPGDIASGASESVVNGLAVIVDPVGAILVDGQGRRLGYSQAEGQLSEIPGSKWFGDTEGFGLVLGEYVAPLHLELTGLGADHYVMVAVERNGKPNGGAISTGFLAEGQVVSVPVAIIQRNYLPLAVR